MRKVALLILTLFFPVVCFSQYTASRNPPYLGRKSSNPPNCTQIGSFYISLVTGLPSYCTALGTPGSWSGDSSTTSVTGASQQMNAGSRYISKNNSVRVALTLPTACNEGQTVTVNGYGTQGWRVAQNAGQVIHGNTDSTIGAGGYIQSQSRYDSVTLVCVIANTEWLISNSQGTLTIF